MSLFSKQESFLGVDIGAHGIKLVEFKKIKGRPQLWTYGMVDEPLDIHIQETHEKTSEELLAEEQNTFVIKNNSHQEILPDDPRIEKYAGFLKQLIKEARVTTKKATASLPVSYIFHTVLTLPMVEDKEIDHIIRAEVKKMLARPIEDMQIVHQKIPDVSKEKKYLRVLVTAAPRDLVKFYTAIFQKAGLELQELETEAFALERSLVGHDISTVMVVDIGAERTNFFIIDQSLPLTHRSISLGGDLFTNIIKNTLKVDENLANQIKMDTSKIKELINSEIFTSAIEPILKEVEYGFDLFLSQTGTEGKHPEKIILTGGSAVLPFIKDELVKKFPMKVFVGDPWARVIYQEGLKTVLDNIGPRMSVAIGLALRNIV